MKKIMLLGPRGVGKSTLAKKLMSDDSGVSKTVVPEYYDDILDTPGEYIEHPRYYGRFQVLVGDYDIVCLVVSCLTDNVYVPPNFVSMFQNKEVIGIITKIDLCDGSDIEKCRKILFQAGVNECYEVSAFDYASLEKLLIKINN